MRRYVRVSPASARSRRSPVRSSRRWRPSYGARSVFAPSSRTRRPLSSPSTSGRAHSAGSGSARVEEPTGTLRSLTPVKKLLLAWFVKNGRDLPWRATRDPYAILVSEVMAQQTQIDRVVPRWERWLERWPTVEALAGATAADVIREWQGLGY